MWLRRPTLLITSRSLSTPCRPLSSTPSVFALANRLSKLGTSRLGRPQQRSRPPRKTTDQNLTVNGNVFWGAKAKAKVLDTVVIPAHPHFSLRHIAYFVIGKGASWISAKSAPLPPPAPPNRNMLVTSQICTAPTGDTSGACVLLHYETKRYIIGNIGEGTQRAFTQRKVALNKTQDLFVSGVVDWRSCGGLIGAILTLADGIATARQAVKGVNRERALKGRREVAEGFVSYLNIHGSKNLTYMLASARRFVFRKGLPLKPLEVKSDPAPKRSENEADWRDENIKVWYLPIESTNEAASSPRKRSHEEFMRSDPSTEAEDDAVIASVVEQMFNSDWKMDALYDSFLHDVQLPAKIFIRDDKGHIKPYTGPMPGPGKDLSKIPNIGVLVRKPWPAATVINLPKTEPSPLSMCYILKGHDTRGKFNPEVALKHGVVRTDFKLLTAGQTVKGADGVEVTPDMVLGATVEGKGIAFVDLPDVSYVEKLVKRSEWSNSEIMKGIQTIYWSVGASVAQDSRIQEFMQRMSSVQHVVCAPDVCPNQLTMESAAVQAYKLHSIDPKRFPIPYYDNTKTVSESLVPTKSPLFEMGKVGKTIQLAPAVKQLEKLIVPFPDIQDLASQNSDQRVRGQVARLTERAMTKVNTPEFKARVEKIESDIPNRDAEIVTLGTGSALPSKYRNVSATLVRVPGYGNYLFDCGENTLGQLRRVFGPELQSVLQNLKGIWISHLHADHHLGTAALLKAWNEATKETPAKRLFVSSEPAMAFWIREYANVEDFGGERIDYLTFDEPGLKQTKIFSPKILNEEKQKMFGLQQINACYVDHCKGALAVVITWPSGLKIAYSGDCRPSKEFAEIGQGATLLIHESTFDDTLKGDAVAKKHSTMGEAIDIGRQMGARRILLTHFSQRYQKIANIVTEVPKVEGKVSEKEKARLDEVVLVAFDYMRVKLGEFREAQAFVPAVSKLFENIGDDQ